METDNNYKDMKQDSHLFNFLDYPKSNGLYSVENKTVPGKFKDNWNGKVISKFCRLR